MSAYAAQIHDALAVLGIEPSADRVAALARHLDMVDEANRAFNLTRVDPESAVALHIVDSLLALPQLDDAPPGRFADIGSGAGFPGIPLAVLSGREVSLVESVKKKAAFLERVVAELRLKATVHPTRAEELASEAPGAYSAVTARALSALPSLVELAAPLLADGGRLVALKGRPEPEELARGVRAAALCGLTEVQVAERALPGTDIVRTIVVYQRTGRPTVRLPRRPGAAQRDPLA